MRGYVSTLLQGILLEQVMLRDPYLHAFPFIKAQFPFVRGC